MKKITFSIILTLFFWGCEEVIEVDINSTDPQIIIEAQLTNSLEKNIVKITQSTDFYEPNEYDKITNASVTITDQAGNKYLIEEILPGEYHHPTLKSLPKMNYSIEVDYKNTTYKAESYTPQPILIDSLSYKLEPRPFNDKLFLELHVHFQDPEDELNYARFVIYKNNEKINKIFIYDDRLTNGNEIDYFFFNFDEDEEFNSGDEILVELQSFDQQTHTYFRTLRRALATSTGGPFGPASPTNPETNWDNNAFGYFSAYSFDSKTLVIE